MTAYAAARACGVWETTVGKWYGRFAPRANPAVLPWQNPRAEVLRHPKEEYTKCLMASAPKIGRELA